MVMTATWTGKSGQKYAFETYPIGQELLPLAGVYVFFTIPQKDVARAIYVGETEDFSNRLNSGLRGHLGYKRALAYGVTHVAVRVVTDNTVRLAIETDLRHGLNPPANLQGILSGVGK